MFRLARRVAVFPAMVGALMMRDASRVLWCLAVRLAG